MLINFYKIFFVLLLFIIVYLNISVPINYELFIGVYPYLLSLTALIAVFLLIVHFFENALIIRIAHIITSLFLVFFIFTLGQILRNIPLLNNYSVEDENTKAPISSHNEALIISNGREMFDEILDEISRAKNHIHIEFFILRDDSIGHKFKNVLIKKANEGVEVRFIYDGVGSILLKRNYYKDLRDAGVDIQAYNNVFQSIMKGKLNNRNHRKIVIIDGQVGFTGGMNIGDEYLGRDDSIGNWKDILVKIKGEAVDDMQRIFLDDWYYITGENLKTDQYFSKSHPENTLPVQIVSGAYDTSSNEISQSFYSIIKSAKHRLYIVTPYFVPNDSIMDAIKFAALNGVDVKIILPKNPDHFLVGWVNASFYEELLKNKVKLYLYEDGFLHSKVFVADDKTVSIGSANLNMRSQYLDYEMNAILFDQSQVETMTKELYKDIENSKEVTLEEYDKRSLTERIKERLGVFIRPLV